ncbi:MAG: VOC family protein [Dokdonella sp.]
MTEPASTTSTIIPGLRYRDAHAAIEWLCNAFGFHKHAIHEDGKGGIAHAQLTFGNGMVMVGSLHDDDYGRKVAQPDQIDRRVTQTAYVIVADCKGHYERARSAGAEIDEDYAEKDYGGAGYGCRDLEGHLWWFGDYDPWKTE